MMHKENCEKKKKTRKEHRGLCSKCSLCIQVNLFKRDTKSGHI